MSTPFRPLLAFPLVLLLAGCMTTPSPTDPLAAARAKLQASSRKNSPSLCFDAARLALPLAIGKTTPSTTRAQALALYNTAVARAVVQLMKHPSTPGYDVTFALPPGIDRFLAADTIGRNHMKTDNRRPGIGGTLVGVSDNPSTATPNRPLKGFTTPWTAVAEFGSPRDGSTPVSIRFYDPRFVDSIRIDGSTQPLAGDFTAPLAYFPQVNHVLFGVTGMLFSDQSARRSSLLFFEPYDPNKIPVVFVHGLMSSPHTWLEVANQLQANPQFRRRYQLWAYFYPSGAPIPANALGLREALAAADQRYHLKPNIILIGHSMGGILSRMQVTNSGRTIWNNMLRDKADSMARQVRPDSVIARALIFKANPKITRCIFIATPHRGSILATMQFSNMANSLIRMPVSLVKELDYHTAGVIRHINPTLRSIPTSIQGLSPNSPILAALDKTRPVVPFHSIIGNRGRDSEPLAESSDGVVPYWSSHLDEAQSELIVPTGHNAFNHPASILEMERILGVAEKHDETPSLRSPH